MEDSDRPADIDSTVPQSARVWNYWLGGKDNFAVDRQVGDQIREMNPHIVEIAIAARQFLIRAVTLATPRALRPAVRPLGLCP